jgi:ribose transport system substrate-binding protein
MKKLLGLLCVLLLATQVYANGTQETNGGQPTLDVVAFTCQDLGNPYFKVMGDAVVKSAHDINPACKVVVQSADNDLNKQSTQIDDFISSGAKVIVVNAVDSEGIGPAVQRAKEAGIKVIAADVGAKGADATMTSNNYDAGKLVAQYIVDRLKGKGNVIAINGDPNTACIDRFSGMKDVFKANSGINLLSSDQNGKGRRELSMNLVTDLLTKFDHVDAIWGVNDPTALGAELAIKQAGRKGIFVVGIDGSPDAAVAMAEPDSIFAASSAQDPYYMAYHAVQVGWDMMNGKQPEKKVELIPVSLVTDKEVAAGYNGWSIPK